MSERIRAHLRSHIVGYLALFVALSGSAVALPGKFRIDRNDLRPRVVKPFNIQRNAVQPYQLAPRAVRGFHVAPNALGGFHIDERTLGEVRSAANGIEADARTIADDTTQTIIELAQGRIRLQCDATPQLIYDNESGAPARAWGDTGADTPASVPVAGSHSFGLLTTDHVELAIVTDNNLAFVDFNLERTALPHCLVAWSLSQTPGGGF